MVFDETTVLMFVAVSDALLEGLEVGLVRGAGVGGLRAGVEGCVGFVNGG